MEYFKYSQQKNCRRDFYEIFGIWKVVWKSLLLIEWFQSENWNKAAMLTTQALICCWICPKIAKERDESPKPLSRLKLKLFKKFMIFWYSMVELQYATKKNPHRKWMKIVNGSHTNLCTKTHTIGGVSWIEERQRKSTAQPNENNRRRTRIITSSDR